MKLQNTDVRRFGIWPRMTAQLLAREEWRASCSEYEADLRFLENCLECFVFVFVAVVSSLFIL